MEILIGSPGRVRRRAPGERAQGLELLHHGVGASVSVDLITWILTYGVSLKRRGLSASGRTDAASIRIPDHDSEVTDLWEETGVEGKTVASPSSLWESTPTFNGSQFINAHLFGYHVEEQLTFTKGRPRQTSKTACWSRSPN